MVWFVTPGSLSAAAAGKSTIKLANRNMLNQSSAHEDVPSEIRIRALLRRVGRMEEGLGVAEGASEACRIRDTESIVKTTVRTVQVT